MIDYYPYMDNSSHGHDAYDAAEEDGVLFVAVADGLTSSDHPHEAAKTAIQCALAAFREEPRQELEAFVQRLHEKLRNAAANWSRQGSAETTLTTLILHQSDAGSVDAMFTASGDSPIYVAYPGPIMALYPDTFLTVQVHGKPIQVENEGRVYSYVDCSTGRVNGRLARGTFRMSVGELCIVCTDGVPFAEHILRDLRRGGGSHRFFNEMFTGDLKSATDGLFSRFRSAEALSDDATMIAISVRASGAATPANALGQVESLTGAEEGARMDILGAGEGGVTPGTNPIELNSTEEHQVDEDGLTTRDGTLDAAGANADQQVSPAPAFVTDEVASRDESPREAAWSTEDVRNAESE
jgi:hypothetical protein